MFPTGNVDQPDTITLTLTVPVNLDTTADDWLLDAIVGTLISLTDPAAWDATGYTITPAQAAARALQAYNSLVLS